MSLLPNQSQVNADTAFFAPASGGGGGGGGGGPNPVVSTLTFPAAVPTPSGPTAGGIIFSQQLLLDDLATNIAGDFAFTAAQPYPTGLAGATSTTSLTIFAPQNGCTLTLGCGEDEVVYIDAAAGGGDPAMIIRGIGGISVSSMTISSINGQVPGGGGAGPNLTISTLTTNVAGYIEAPAIGGSLRLEQDASVQGAHLNYISSGVNTSQLQFSPSSIVANNTSFQVSNPIAGQPLVIEANDTNLYNIGVPGQASIEIGVVGGRKQMYASVGEIDDCMVSSIVAVAGAKIQMLDPLIVSEIDGVTTINGAPPAVAPTRTGVNTWSTLDIPGDGTNTAVTPGFTTIAGHLYSLQGFLYANASPNITSNACLAFQIGNIDRAYQPAIPLIGYSAAGTAGLAFGNNIPVSMTWRAATGAVNNAVYGQMVDAGGATTSTSITATSALTLFDYGPVA